MTKRTVATTWKLIGIDDTVAMVYNDYDGDEKILALLFSTDTLKEIAHRQTISQEILSRPAVCPIAVF